MRSKPLGMRVKFRMTVWVVASVGYRKIAPPFASAFGRKTDFFQLHA
ncbi:hypothetical protein Poly59_20120 [Rubripirellula reticaptiva]|uniref:Uncharacterized protein n=1 Tax=Rubripirellula reticaptiva TaxID=2528013 RepID=A0A5C6F3J8_9BACT|nr:hypothetical protein Poly59_20120 [Rubripirellula reticaptiva]